MRHRRYDSALSRAIDPDWQWRDLTPNLLAMAADSLAWLVWSKTPGAQKKPPQHKPRPIPRPATRPKKNPEVVTADIDEVKRRLALPRRDASPGGVGVLGPPSPVPVPQ